MSHAVLNPLQTLHFHYNLYSFTDKEIKILNGTPKLMGGQAIFKPMKLVLEYMPFPIKLCCL